MLKNVLILNICCSGGESLTEPLFYVINSQRAFIWMLACIFRCLVFFFWILSVDLIFIIFPFFIYFSLSNNNTNIPIFIFLYILYYLLLLFLFSGWNCNLSQQNKYTKAIIKMQLNGSQTARVQEKKCFWILYSQKSSIKINERTKKSPKKKKDPKHKTRVKLFGLCKM